jgi:hypothetical protein
VEPVIIVTTAGTLLIERRPQSEFLYVRAQDSAPLVSLIKQLELFGASDNPPQLAYAYSDIVEEPDAPVMPYTLVVNEQDVALFIQAELLNFLTYRKFTGQPVDEVGGRLRAELYKKETSRAED